MIFKLVESDTGSLLRVDCRNADEDKTPIALAGSSVMLRYTVAGNGIQERPMTLSGPSTADYLFAAGELIAGRMTAEVKITDAAGRQLTNIEPLTLIIRERLS